ncbi:MAG: NAD(P)/FAD-dependent oxidoreductase [Alphaproteobacteria bacterium]|nr:NAD(P)/FAD-dependent oxidoreductase [Alphaproteobacteria bacterium]
MPEVSAVVIGAGVDGLVAASMLARRGVTVSVLEAAEEIGGAARTLAFHPGFRIPLAPERLLALRPGLVWESGIDLHDLTIVPHGTSVAIGEDGRSLARHLDDEADLRALAALAPGDALRMPLFETMLARGGALADRLGLGEPLGVETARAFLKRSRRVDAALLALGADEAHECARLLSGALGALLDRHFADPLVKAGLAGPALLGSGLGPMAPGTAAGLLLAQVGAQLAPPRTGAHLMGGLKGFVEALGRAAAAAGASLRVNATVRELTLKHDRVAGVVLESGEALPADLVLSTLPARASVELLEAGPLREALLGQLPAAEPSVVTARAAFALERAPRWTALPPALHRHIGPIQLAPDLGGLERASDAARAGAVPDAPWAELHLASALDAGLAPPGKALLTVTLSPLPGALSEGWSAEAEAGLLDHLQARIGAVARGFEATIEGRTLALGAGAGAGSFRLFGRGAGRLDAGGRAGPKNLYLCGAADHAPLAPLGTAGLKAAKLCLADLSGLKVA